MKLASIVPMNNVERTFDGDFAMLLTHLSNYYPTEHSKSCYVIMDNSLIELKEAASIEATYKAASRCKADELILPDVFRDKEKTLVSVEEGLEWLSKKNLIDDFNLMAVCQGSTVEEFSHCFEILETFDEITCIGIPKVTETIHPNGRPGFEPLWENCKKDIHLLGCWTTLSELKEYKHPEIIRSCDTCIPALLSRDGIQDVWARRPAKTIDLENDFIQADIYESLLKQLKEKQFL